MRALHLAAAVVALGSVSAFASSAVVETASARDATVFIQVIGDIRVEVERGWKHTFEKADVPIATGSGFLISPFGQVITNHHVVSGHDLTVVIEGQPFHVNLAVKRIEVLVPGPPGSGQEAVRRFAAAVDAQNPTLDLALLSVTGIELPFLPLGDSDALEPGQPIEVVGFPLGRDVDVGRTTAPDAVPEPTHSRGTVSALRAGDEGDRRFIQTDANINPGNSGGPLLDEEGYVVGVVRMKSRRGSGIGFAIPVNQVKDFLEATGQERIFPGRRLKLGAAASLGPKGLRLRLPDGFDDEAPSRLRVKAGLPPDETSLMVERAATPLSLADLEARLRSGQGFPEFTSATAGRSHPTQLGEWRAVAGSGTGSGPRSGPDLAIEYAILDLGPEKVVARYIGPASQVAFNRAVLRGSLQSLEAERLLTAEIKATVKADLEPVALPLPGSPLLAFPRGWPREASPPRRCRALPRPDAVLAASPEGDFTVSLRAAWWSTSAGNADSAAAACSWPRGALGAASYSAASDRLGVRFVTEGLFLPVDGGLLQLEVEAPPAKIGFVSDLFRAWVAVASH